MRNVRNNRLLLILITESFYTRALAARLDFSRFSSPNRRNSRGENCSVKFWRSTFNELLTVFLADQVAIGAMA
jgi:hypothetical protein